MHLLFHPMRISVSRRTLAPSPTKEIPVFQLHPRSLLVGLALGGVVLFSMAQSAAPTYATVRMQYMPHPRDMVQLQEGAPFTVPVGKILVVTGCGSTLAGGSALESSLFIDGKQVLFVWPGINTGTSVHSLAAGLSAKAGSSVSLASPTGNAAASGYLADQ